MARMFVKEWRKARNLTQEQLAELLEASVATVSRIEAGKQDVTNARLDQLADIFRIQPAILFSGPPEAEAVERGDGPLHAGMEETPAMFRRDGRSLAKTIEGAGLVGWTADLPIYASAEGGPTGMVVTFDPIDWVKRPEPLFNVASGFGMYVVGESMAPAYRQGDMILVHPRRPAGPGDDVLVIKKNGHGESSALVKNLVQSSPQEIRLRQYNPAQDFSVPRTEIEDIFLIVGKYNRR